MKTKLHIVLIVTLSLVWLILLQAVSFAATYYLDAVNGNDSNPGTSVAPWRTIAKAESSAVNGSTVYLRSGNYGEVYINSTGLNRNSWDDGVTYEAEDGAAPVFSWTDITGSEDRYVTFKNISFIGPDNSDIAVILIVDSSHVRIIDCNITRPWPPTVNTQRGIWIEGKNRGIYDILIDGCDIQGGYQGILTYRDIRDGIVIRNNHIHLTASSFITLQSFDNNGEIIVENNHLHNRQHAMNAHGSGLAVRVNRLTVRGNIIHDYGGSGGINFYDDRWPDPEDGYEDMLIENNLVYDAQSTNNSRFSKLKSNITIRNNTLIGYRESPESSGKYKYHAAIFKPKGAGGVTNLNIHNNVFVGYVGISGDIYSFTEDNNIWWAILYGTVWLDTPPGPNSIIVYNVDDDYFEGSGKFFIGGADFDTYSYTHPDNYSHRQNLNTAYKLALGSPAIGFAGPDHATATDLLGNSRDAAPDAGCYEYISIGPQPPVADAGPDQTVIDEDKDGKEQVTLDGSGSMDPDGTVISYVWTEDGTQIATGVNPTVTLSTGVHTIMLTVTDDGGLTAMDTVTISIVTPANQHPIANAGADQTVTDTDGNGSEEVTLDGSGSQDPDGTIVSYVWSEDGLQIATGINPTVTLSIGTHLITLTVTDNGGLIDTDTVTIKVLEGDKEFGKLPTGCYNNVFNPTKGEKALIWVELSKPARVKVNLYNTRGNKIRKLADEERDAETCKYYWNGRDDSGNIVGSGLYFVHIQAGDYKKTKKIVVVK